MFRFPALSAVTSDRSDAPSHIAHSHRVKGSPYVGRLTTRGLIYDVGIERMRRLRRPSRT